MPNFDYLKINVASPVKIREWGSRTCADGVVVGELITHDTLHYKWFTPVKGGLFCDRIFGTLQDWTCTCGKYCGKKHAGIVCRKCKVEITVARGRRHNVGMITLQTSITHIWYLLGSPSYIGILLNVDFSNLVSVVYFAAYIVLQPDEENKFEKRTFHYKDVIDSNKWQKFETLNRLKNNLPLWARPHTKARVGMGGESIEKLLSINWSYVSDSLKKQMAIFARKSPVKKMLFTSKLQRSSVSMQRSKRKNLSEIELVDQYKKILKRLKLIQNLRRAKSEPAWMVLQVLPVIPPDLRPMTRVEGLLLNADLNEFYRVLIIRNNRLKCGERNVMP